MNRDEIIEALSKPCAKPVLAKRLIELDGDNAVPAILNSICLDCACETIPNEKIQILGSQKSLLVVDSAIGILDELNYEESVEEDAGDIADEYWRIRSSMTKLLAECGQVAKAKVLDQLETKNTEVLHCYISVLASLGVEEANSKICDIFNQYRDVDFSIHLSCLEYFGSVKSESNRELLISELTRKERRNDGWFRRMAANNLGHYSDTGSISRLMSMCIEDSEWYARLGAVEGLKKVNDKSVVLVLERCLNDENYNVGVTAVEALSKFKGKRVYKILKDCVSSQSIDEKVKNKASDGLSNFSFFDRML